MQAITPENVSRHLDSLVTDESRAVGYPGEKHAAQYIRSQFAAMGLQNLTVDTFAVVVPIDRGAHVTFSDSTSVPIFSLWPNQIQTSTLPLAQLAPR